VEPNLDFYATAAQVIPIIFFALAIELRGFLRSPTEEMAQDLAAFRPRAQQRIADANKRSLQRSKEEELARPLTPEESFELDAQATAIAATVVQDTFDPFERRFRIGRVLAGIGSLIAISILVLGEAVALRVLERREGGSFESALVETALWIGAGLVVLPLIDTYIKAIGKDIPFAASRRYLLSYGITATVLVTAWLAWDAM
jgi:hypothetical protein